jgi:glutamate formiminotransferase
MPARGARFVTWSGACRHNRSVCSVVMNSNKVVRATFTKNLFISET